MLTSVLFRQVSSKAVMTAVLRPAAAAEAFAPTLSHRSMFTMPEETDPEKIFDKLDTNNDNFISRDEFRKALSNIQYDELLKVHEAARTNLENLSKKLETVHRIEAHIADLEATYEEKQNHYNNVGWETSADIDALFTKSKSSKDEMKDAVTELKNLIEEAKDVFTSAKQQVIVEEEAKVA